ncbi:MULTISPECIES: HAD family hydrolase [Streptomyces]|uniref:HAD family hydrolase n=1 Tax=Streptomyces TaxID=1883 RepID=UPI001E54FD82|nr:MULTISPECIES: HAD family phosphatase [Streptomyces]UFQ14340.1 HAD family phosphatase [Streptomyces huasconensis]WCL83940.1 HAD family phosphatase [Streptomyces sp. JCM 35825]
MTIFGRTSVVLDLDGTLVDSEPNYYEASRALLADRAGREYTWADNEQYVGVSSVETLAQWKAEYGIEASAAELLADLDRRYLALARASTPVYPEMRKLVERLHEAGVPMAVASGSSRAAIEAILAGTGLDAQLTTLVSAEEVPRGKPAPDVFLAAAALLGADPADCVVFEDAAPGAEAARAAGMRCVAIPSIPAHATHEAFAHADLLFPGGHAEFTAQAALELLASRAQA